MAEQRTEDEKKKQEELRLQYEKEQDMYNNRLLVSTESKDKLSLNFMYEAPPGAKKERLKEDDEPEYKFEWQRNAPRESFAKNNMEIRDQPFGIQVRNVRCIKCHKWGHLNTDRECPLYNQNSSIMDGAKVNPGELIRAMQEDGLALKKTLIGQKFDPNELNQIMVPKEEEDPEMAFLRSLSSKEKKKLLKKLNKLSGVNSKSKDKSGSKKHKKDRKKRHSSSHSESSEYSSDDEKKHSRRKSGKGSTKRDRHSKHSSQRHRDHSRDKREKKRKDSSEKERSRKDRHRSPKNRSISRSRSRTPRHSRH